MKEKIIKILKEIIPYIVVIIIALLIRNFIAYPVRVKGSSMSDTLTNGDILLLNKLDKNYERFDIVVVDIGTTKIIKRIIGLPGEAIEYKDNALYINNQYVEDVTDEVTTDFSLSDLYNYEFIPEGYYFVMGDNRDGSSDSRSKEIGLINKKDIEGTVVFRFWPFNKFGGIK